MKSPLSKILLLLYMAISTQAGAKDWAADKWEFLYEKDNVRVYRKEIPGTNVKGVAGESLIDANPGKLIHALLDHDHKGEWIEHYESAHDVDDHPPEYNVQYSIFDLPFPVTNRDFLVRNDFSIDPELKAMVVDVKSVVDPKVPEKKGLVRGDVVKGRFVMTPQADGKTLVQAEYLTDPKGMVPIWLVNMLQKQWPYKTLMALREHVKKPYVREWDAWSKHWKPKLDAAMAAPVSASSARPASPAAVK